VSRACLLSGTRISRPPIGIRATLIFSGYFAAAFFAAFFCFLGRRVLFVLGNFPFTFAVFVGTFKDNTVAQLGIIKCGYPA